MVILRTHRLEEVKKISEKVINLLYRLEDLNSYRSNSLTKVINEFNKIKWGSEICDMRIDKIKISDVIITSIKNKEKYLKKGYKIMWIKKDTIAMEKFKK